MAEESLLESESVGRSIALKPGMLGRPLMERQIEFLQQHIELRGKHESKLNGEIERLTHENVVARINIFRERLRIVLEVMLGLVVLVMLGFLIHMLYSAWKAENVIISAFDVPPALEAQGNSGKVLASSLLDRLQQLQSETRASVAKRGISDAWSGDIKLEIPEAHISVGELQRYLHEWLGNETRIGGSVVQAADGALLLTVRGSGFPARTFSGKADALPALTTQAAEYIYGASETYGFGTYLSNHGRDEETVALVKGAYASALPSDQPLLLNIWGNALADIGRYQEALDKYREAIRLKPDYWVGWSNLVNIRVNQQQEEAALQTGLAMERAAGRGGLLAKRVRLVLFVIADQLRWDLPTVHLAQIEDMALHGGHGTQSVEEAAVDAQTLAQMHDPRRAELELQTSPGAGTDAFVIAQTSFVRGLIALERGEYAQALPLLQSTDTAVAASANLQSNFSSAASCWLALAEEWTGQAAKADADIARGGTLVDCYRFKADVSDHRGDWTLAQKQYAEAVALAPSVPSSYFSWGEALARHGDYDGAIGKFKDANRRGPHWADPLRSWGDALAAKGDLKAAVKQYERAEEFAPSWAELQLRWGQALDKLGQHTPAVEHYRKALGLDLTDVERKSLDGCCG